MADMLGNRGALSSRAGRLFVECASAESALLAGYFFVRALAADLRPLPWVKMGESWDRGARCEAGDGAPKIGSARDGGGHKRLWGRCLIGGLAVLLSVCLVGVVLALSATAGKTARPASTSSAPSSTPTFDAVQPRPETPPGARRALISSSERASVAAQRSTARWGLPRRSSPGVRSQPGR